MSVSMGREIQNYNSLFQAFLFLALLSKFSLNKYAAGQPRNSISIPGKGKNAVFSTLSRLALVPTQFITHWVPEVKRLKREPHHSPPYSAVAKTAWTTRLHGLVLN